MINLIFVVTRGDLHREGGKGGWSNGGTWNDISKNRMRNSVLCHLHPDLFFLVSYENGARKRFNEKIIFSKMEKSS